MMPGQVSAAVALKAPVAGRATTGEPRAGAFEELLGADAGGHESSVEHESIEPRRERDTGKDIANSTSSASMTPSPMAERPAPPPPREDVTPSTEKPSAEVKAAGEGADRRAPVTPTASAATESKVSGEVSTEQKPVDPELARAVAAMTPTSGEGETVEMPAEGASIKTETSSVLAKSETPANAAPKNTTVIAKSDAAAKPVMPPAITAAATATAETNATTTNNPATTATVTVASTAVAATLPAPDSPTAVARETSATPTSTTATKTTTLSLKRDAIANDAATLSGEPTPAQLVDVVRRAVNLQRERLSASSDGATTSTHFSVDYAVRGALAAAGFGTQTPLHGAGSPTTGLPPALSTPLALDSPQFAQACAERVMYCAKEGVQQAEIRLDPAELGKISIRISVDGDRVHAQFSAAQPQAREALELSLPKLREMFAQQGLQLASADVGAQAQRDFSRQSAPMASGVVARADNVDAVEAPRASATVRVPPRGVLDDYA